MVHFTYGDCMVETVYTGHGNKAIDIANVYILPVNLVPWEQS